MLLLEIGGQHSYPCAYSLVFIEENIFTVPLQLLDFLVDAATVDAVVNFGVKNCSGKLLISLLCI